MRRRVALLLLAAACLLGAAPPPQPASKSAAKPASKPASKTASKPAQKLMAPDAISHANAIFLRNLSDDGKQRVLLRAAAHDKHFFFEETAGVTVYQYDGSGYKKLEFLRGATLATAMKKYPK